jgi:CRP-like cAMP-binding protein
VHCRYIIGLTEADLNFELKRPKNMILGALPRDDLEKLYPLLEFVTLKARQVLQHSRIPMDYLYFIEDGLVSVVAKADERRSVEVWLTLTPVTGAVFGIINGANASNFRRLR